MFHQLEKLRGVNAGMPKIVWVDGAVLKPSAAHITGSVGQSGGVRGLRVLGVIPRAGARRSSSDIYGAYHSRSHSIVLSRRLSPDRARSLAFHELAHAVQASYVPSSYLTVTGDARTARLALGEGDALAMELALTPKWGPWFSLRSLQRIDRRFAKPDFVGLYGAFRYAAGLRFVASLYKAGGAKAIRQAFSNPPASSEQILHPGKYQTNEQPKLVVAPRLSGGRADTSLGELGAAAFLMHHGTKPKLAYEAAEGWGGDLLRWYSNGNDGDGCVVWFTTWDTELEAGEFFNAASAVVESAMCSSGPIRGDGEFRCRRGAKRAVLVSRAGKDVVLLVNFLEPRTDAMLARVRAKWAVKK